MAASRQVGASDKVGVGDGFGGGRVDGGGHCVAANRSAQAMGPVEVLRQQSDHSYHRSECLVRSLRYPTADLDDGRGMARAAHKVGEERRVTVFWSGSPSFGRIVRSDRCEVSKSRGADAGP